MTKNLTATITSDHTATTATDVDFYTPPALTRKHRLGEILRLRPTATPNLPGAGAAWQILYVSRDTHGDRIPVSGTVIAPDSAGDLGAGPVLVYYPSFHGLGGACAPSQLLAAGTEPDAEQISAALTRGWPVAVADGEGLGVLGHGPHTFLAGRAAGQVVLDLARAAVRIPALHAVGAPILVWGYADGGRAACWAGGLQPRYAPELDLRAVAAGAVVTEPGPFLRHIDASRWPALGLAGLLGLSHAHRHLTLRHVFTATARLLLTDAETASRTQLCERYQHTLAAWCDRPDPWDDPVWRHVLALELVKASGTPAVPVHLYHGTGDAVVPIEFGRRLADDLRSRGTRVEWQTYNANHFRTARTAIEDVLAALAGHLTNPTGASDASGRTHPRPA
ncbi:lipase family protein [Nocardia wallacei]|uniref:lipase family protein n=1 Tax=Nocardia wallacei TaxID=480035 RepID=UPI00245705EA|nr:lipase family protein [Nocardia wallacei]